ncbi:GDSL esterase/lipase [Quillaja saponaria]|uniref:GDSL esterase/lipase n=1 Tax=Quillaja saponaria TaxID=32244 RepID=A0AAD7KR07_QUISA|nr:GDSL esterase/lipase [Quillaja saponaria]
MMFLSQRNQYLSCSFILQYCVSFIFFQQYASAAAVSLPNNETVPALIVFGDSIVDPGNNNYVTTLIKCDFYPYGRDFAGGNPTGRFSNGLVPSDMIAEKFGFCLGPVLSLSDQINMFKDYTRKLKEAVGENRTATIISKSIYIVCTGSDDLANTYAQTPVRRAQYDIPAYTDLMAESASKFLQELYGLGARRIGVFSLTAIGCVPSQRTLSGGLERVCSDSSNQAAQLFNSKLISQMDSLRRMFPDARLVYLDNYKPLLSLIQNPSQYGFEVVDKGCCGTGDVEVSILCNRYSVNTCSNASNYIFWDSYHPTEKAYNILSSMVLDKNIKNFF